MRSVICVSLLPLMAVGCTSIALERRTLNQVATLTDLRFQQILDDLAATACNAAILPSYAPVGEGTALVQDTMIFDAKTLWARAMGGTFFKGFVSETFSLTGTRQPQPQWTLDPASETLQLQAMQYAFVWAVCGCPPPVCSDAEKLLQHFQAYDALARMPAGWLHVGTVKDCCGSKCYSGRWGGTYVWVEADGMEGLSAFTLVIQDIATVDLKSLYRQPGAGAVKIKCANPEGTTGDNMRPTIDAKARAVFAPTIIGPCGDDIEQEGSRIVIFNLPNDFGPEFASTWFRLAADYCPSEMEPLKTDRAKAAVPPSHGRGVITTINPRQNFVK